MPEIKGGPFLCKESAYNSSSNDLLKWQQQSPFMTNSMSM
jgi:hypothetical protein